MLIITVTYFTNMYSLLHTFVLFIFYTVVPSLYSIFIFYTCSIYHCILVVSCFVLHIIDTTFVEQSTPI